MLPLFSCYVFIQGYSDRYLDIVRTAGVHDFVCCAGLPAPISSGAIEDIRQVVERSIKIDPHPFIRCGDRVRVKSGPLEGIEGVLVRKKNLSRLVLTVELLGKSAAVEIDVSLVERISLRGRCFASTERRYDCLTFTHVKSSPYVVPSDFTDKQLSAELWAK
jgi:transcription antitermination factor NusG